MKMALSCWMTFAIALLLGGCSALQPPKVANTHFYTLDAISAINPVQQKIPQVLAISMPGARPGFDTPQIAYQRQPLELEYFATQRWVDTPAKMLRPLLVQTLEPVFQAIIATPGSIHADLRLDTELIRLQQDFSLQPSLIHLMLRVQLIDLKDKNVISTKLFDVTETAASEDAYGGVVAANRALLRVLEQLPEFCRKASSRQ